MNIMAYSQNPKREDSNWIMEQLDHLIKGDEETNITTTTTTTTTIIIETTNITETINNTNNDDEELQPPTTPPTQLAAKTTVEEEYKLAALLTPLWFQEVERLEESNLIVLTDSFEKIKGLESELKKRDDLLRRFAEKTDELADALIEEKQQNELREKTH